MFHLPKADLGTERKLWCTWWPHHLFMQKVKSWFELFLQAVLKHLHKVLLFWSWRLFPFSCSTLQGFCYGQAVGQTHQCHQSGWRTCFLRAEHREPYAYQPLRDYTLAQEEVLRTWSHAEPASECFCLGFHCDTKNLTISRLFAVTLSSFPMTSPYGQGVCFLCNTPSEVNTLFNISVFLIDTSRYTSNTTSTRTIKDFSLVFFNGSKQSEAGLDEQSHRCLLSITLGLH